MGKESDLEPLLKLGAKARKDSPARIVDHGLGQEEGRHHHKERHERLLRPRGQHAVEDEDHEERPGEAEDVDEEAQQKDQEQDAAPTAIGLRCRVDEGAIHQAPLPL